MKALLHKPRENRIESHTFAENNQRYNIQRIGMKERGLLRKMKGTLAEPITYSLDLGSKNAVILNSFIGSQFNIVWTGRIFCLRCGRSIQKTYGDGLCFQCFSEAPEASPCIIRPELCEAHNHQGRDVEWELNHHFQPHVVYLAQTNIIKIGVTREIQVPSRWIDQGAGRALIFAITPYRQLAGRIEVEMKQYLSDRTDWRKMLINAVDHTSLEETRDTFGSFLPAELAQYLRTDFDVLPLTYPVLEYPAAIKSIKLESGSESQGRLTGIRGQYLYWDADRVMNIRKYSGFEVDVQAS